MIYDVVSVSGVQRNESFTYKHIATLFKILFPDKSVQHVEKSSLYYTASSSYLFFYPIGCLDFDIFEEFRTIVLLNVHSLDG